MPSLRLLSIGILTFAIGMGCSRSEKFEKDREYYGDYPQAYYGNKGGNPTERVSQMGQPKKRVVIFDFWNDTPLKFKKIGNFTGNELRRGLFLTRRILLPTEVRTQLRTQDFVEGEKVRVAQLVREGRRMGVSVLVIGRISKIVFRQRGDEVGVFRQIQSLAAADVEIKLFDVQNGREIAAIGKSGEASTNSLAAFETKDLSSQTYREELARLALRNAVGKLIPEVVQNVEKMTWQGQIAKVVGPKIYLNAGRAAGLVAGDILRVLTKGDDVYDPETGAFLGRTPGQMKGTLEVVDFLGKDAAISRLHTGGNMAVGDVVRLY